MLHSQIRLLSLLTLLCLQLQYIRCWCYKTTYYELNSQINEVSWSPDGQFIAVASESERVTVYSTETSNVLWYFNAGTPINSVKFNPQSSLLAYSIDRNDTIFLINVPSFTYNTSFRTDMEDNGKEVFDIDFNYNGTKIVACGESGYLSQFTLFPRNKDYTFTNLRQSDSSDVISCRYDKDGNIGVSVESSNYCRWAYLNGANGNPIRRNTEGTRPRVINFRTDSSVNMYGDNNANRIRSLPKSTSGTWNAGSSNIGPSFPENVGIISIARDNSFYAISAASKAIVYILDSTNENTLSTYETIALNNLTVNTAITSLKVSWDSQRFAVATNGAIHIYERVCMECPLGLYMASGGCKLCTTVMAGCATCLTDNVCFSCFPAYYLNAGDKKCYPCSNTLTGCVQCESNAKCKQCRLDYYLESASNQCKSCSSLTPNCEQCHNGNGTCIKCNYLTYLTNTFQCQLCNQTISNCLTCTPTLNTSSPTNSTPICTQCVQNAYLTFPSPAPSVCTQCPLSCLTCFGVSNCTSCVRNYRLQSGLCQLCPTNCINCLDNGTCTECLPSTFLISGACNLCASSCVTCSGLATTCKSCPVGYYLLTGVCTKCLGCSICNPVSGQCSQCGVGFYLNGIACLSCTNSTSRCLLCNSTSCLLCDRNFYLTGGTCQPISAISFCEVYSLNSASVCERCGLGYYLNGVSCDACKYGCLTCKDGTECLQCLPGFYFDTTNKECKVCTDGCVTCSSSSSCLSCGINEYLQGTECKNCENNISNCKSCLNSTHCLDCQMGFSLAANSLSCIKCVSPCVACNTLSCLSCASGYFLASGTCSPCSNNCTHCESATVCLGCLLGFTISSGSCSLCSTLHQDCQYCTETVCLKCKEYFIFNSITTQCESCHSVITGCLSCSLSASLIECTICQPGFYLNSGSQCETCSIALPNCDICDDEDLCLTCQPGFFVNTVSGECDICSDGCSLCSPTECHTCSPGFFKTASACEPCSDTGAGCKLCDNTGCLQCENAYFKGSTSCELCKDALQGCLSCTLGVCLACESGYYLDSDECFLCSTTEGCSSCNATNCSACLSGYRITSLTTCELCSSVIDNCILCNSSGCLACKSGSYLSSQTCLSCSNIHMSCLLCNSTKCLQCNSGFYLNPSSNCIKCAVIGCEICSQSGTTCLSCQSTYYLSSTQLCLSCQSNVGCLHCSNSSECLTCQSGFYLDVDFKCKICSSLFPHCGICNKSLCTSCTASHFHNLTSLSKECLLCNDYLPGCNLCSSNTLCEQCKPGFYQDSLTLVCSPCSSINSCYLCSSSNNCTLCAAGYYVENGACLECKLVIPGCFSCSGADVCTSCSGSYRMMMGECVIMESVSVQTFTSVRIVSEYINETVLKHLLLVKDQYFTEIDQDWNSSVMIELIDSNDNKTKLEIKDVVWGAGEFISSLTFFTNNPFGKIDQNSLIGLPMISGFESRRLLITLEELNMRVNFNMKKAVANQILTGLDTNGQDLGLSYNLKDSEFQRSVINTHFYFYFLFGVVVTFALIINYAIKIIWSVPMTSDAGDIIPHVLLLKVPALLISPSLGGYINYCYGFSYLDLPWLNYFFSEKLTNLADISPSSFRFSYMNMNFASTYLLAWAVFTLIYMITKIAAYFENSNKSKNFNNLNSDSNLFINLEQPKLADEDFVSILDKPEDRANTFGSFFFNLFLAGLVVSSFMSFIGMLLNPSSVISLSGLFYIVGVVVYLLLWASAIKDCCSDHKKSNKLRIVLKGTLMIMMYWSPILLYAALCAIDTIIMFFVYRAKCKEWVVPKVWFMSNLACLLSYGALIFLSNMLLGLIIATSLIIFVVCCDIYLHYKEYQEIVSIRLLKERPKEYSENTLSIEGLIPNKKEILNQRSLGFYFEDNENEKPSRKSSEDSNVFESKRKLRKPIVETKAKKDEENLFYPPDEELYEAENIIEEDSSTKNNKN